MTPFPAPTREGQKMNEEGERARKKAKPEYADTYKILLHHVVDGSEEEQEFILHKALVDAHDSDLFDDCFPRGEGGESWETWKCEDLETFQAWVHWLYTAEIDNRLLLSSEAMTDEAEPDWLALVKLSACAIAMFHEALFNKLADIMLEKFDAKAAAYEARRKNDLDGLWAAYDYVFLHEASNHKMADMFHDMFVTALASVKPSHFAFDADWMTKRTLFAMNLRLLDGYKPFRIPDSKDERRAHRGRYHESFQFE